MMSRNIGGEFALELPESRWDGRNATEQTVFASGRFALRAILRLIVERRGNCTLFLPSYRCRSIDRAADVPGIKCTDYPVDRSLCASIQEERIAACDCTPVVLLIDFFGMQDLSRNVAEVKRLRRDAVVILDKVQAPFEQSVFGADYWFNSYRKAFGVPEGAHVGSAAKEVVPGTKPGAHAQLRLAAAAAKSAVDVAGLDEELHLKLFRQAEQLLDVEPHEPVISELGADILQRVLDRASEAAAKRKRNFSILRGLIDDIGLRCLVEPARGDCVPLFLPVLIEDRDRVRRELRSMKIYCPVHWPDSPSMGIADFIKKHELSLVIDQRYDQEDLSRLASALHFVGTRGAYLAD